MSYYRVMELFCHIAGFGVIVAGSYVLKNPRPPSDSDGVWIAFGLLMLGPTLFCLGLLALLVRRQGEYALHLQELIRAQKGQPTADTASDASSLRKAA